MEDTLELPGGIAFPSLDNAQAWLTTFSNTTALGLAIFDRRLRYQFTNTALARADGISAEAHLGRGLREVLGEVASSVEPMFERAQGSGEVTSKDICGKLAYRENMIYSIACYFPVKASRRGLLGALVIDATEFHQIDTFLTDLTNRMTKKNEKETVRLAVELHDSVKTYLAALRAGLMGLTQHIWRMEGNIDHQLAPIIASLDQRIADMRKLVTVAAARLPAK